MSEGERERRPHLQHIDRAYPSNNEDPNKEVDDRSLIRRTVRFLFPRRHVIPRTSYKSFPVTDTPVVNVASGRKDNLDTEKETL